MAGCVGGGAGALEDADAGVRGTGDFGDEDVDDLCPAEGGGVLASNGGDVAGGVGGVEWTVTSEFPLRAAEGEGEEARSRRY